MKKSRYSQHRRSKEVSRTYTHPLINSGPVFEIIEINQQSIDSVEFDFVRLVVHLPQPDGLWTKAHITVRMGNDVEMPDVITEVLELHASGKLVAMAKEVQHA